MGLPWDVEVVRGAMPSARSSAEEEQGPTSSQPRKQGDLITTEAAEPQRLISSDVLLARVTSLQGSLCNHL